MADTTLTPFGFTLIEVGASEDTWGAKLNDNWTLADGLLDGSGAAITPNLSLGAWKVGGSLVTSTAAELNILDGVTATASELNALDGITATVTELNYTAGVTSAIQTQLNLKATIVSPSFSGTPTAPTQAVGNSTTRIATTAFVNAEIDADVGVANSALVKTALNASGSAPIYACRAWVVFDGTGTPSIAGSGNVSSITDNGTGDYTINLTVAMPSANYAVALACDDFGMGIRVISQTASAIRVSVMDGNYNARDVDKVHVTVFG